MAHNIVHGNAQLPRCYQDGLYVICDSKSREGIYGIDAVEICCHFCSQKKICEEENCERCVNGDITKACIRKTDCSICHSNIGMFCRTCLKLRYGEDIEQVLENKNWIYPHCSEKRGINPY